MDNNILTLQNIGLLTLQNVKDTFYAELARDNVMILEQNIMNLEQYIRERYTPVYDAELNFLGYERN